MGFRKDFLWGGATSASQCEGAWNKDGRGPSKVDVLTNGSFKERRKYTYIDNNGQHCTIFNDVEKAPNGGKYKCFDEFLYPSHEAIDFYHHYKEDIKLFSELGFKTYRMSISWSRLFPNGDEKVPNEKGLKFYKDVFEELKKYNIEPLVTLWHFDTPLYLEEEYGGWQNPVLIDFFVNYCKTCFVEYKDYVKYWLTFNEINNVINDLNKYDDPSDEDYQRVFNHLHNKFIASAKVVKLGHEINKNNMIGCMLCGTVFYPHTSDPNDIMLCLHRWQEGILYCGDVQCTGEYPVYARRMWMEHGLDFAISEADKQVLKEGKVDMCTFSYYATNDVTTHTNVDVAEGNMTRGVKNEYIKYSEWGWGYDPVGFRYICEYLYDRYKLPLMVVENGIGCYDKVESDGTIHDPYRIEYFKEHINELKRCVNEGIDVIGYTTWAPIDLVSNGTGEMAKRYGFIYVDKHDDGSGTLERCKKDSFYWYKKVIESNGEDLD